MKKYLFLLLAACCAIRCAHAASEPKYRFESDSFFIPPEGGVLYCSLAFAERSESGPIRLVAGDIVLEKWSADSRLVRSVRNVGCAFEVEHDMLDTDYGKGFAVAMTLRIVDTGERVEVTLNYSQEPFRELFGGVISLFRSRIYRPGEVPPPIRSTRPALGAVFSLDGSRTTYAWEKRAASEELWTTLPGQTGQTCQPDTMGTETVYYRRKAVRGPHTAWSNTVELLAELDAGLIAISVPDSGSYIYIVNQKNPSVA